MEEVARLQPVGLSELSRVTRLPKTTVNRILRTLDTAGWLSPVGDAGAQRWTLTARAPAVGASATRLTDLRQLARPVLVELGRETDENIHLSVPDVGMLVLIDKVPSTQPVQTVATIGDRVPVHRTASGWAVLSRLGPDEVDAVVGASIAQFDDGPAMDRPALPEELAEVARRGYAVNIGRWRPDVSAIGSAVVDERASARRHLHLHADLPARPRDARAVRCGRAIGHRTRDGCARPGRVRQRSSRASGR